MAMELLEVSDAAMAKYFTMMLDGTACTWLKGLPPNSISSWAELKARLIQNFKDRGSDELQARGGRVYNPLGAPG